MNKRKDVESEYDLDAQFPPRLLEDTLGRIARVISSKNIVVRNEKEIHIDIVKQKDNGNSGPFVRFTNLTTVHKVANQYNVLHITGTLSNMIIQKIVLPEETFLSRFRNVGLTQFHEVRQSDRLVKHFKMNESDRELFVKRRFDKPNYELTLEGKELKVFIEDNLIVNAVFTFEKELLYLSHFDYWMAYPTRQ